MEVFDFSMPTNIRFGKDRLNELPEVLNKFGKKILLVYGGGSIKKIGLYDKILNYLLKNKNEVFELPGVEPNPRINTVRKGVDICKTNNVDVVLAIGGGSTIDCAKVIAAASKFSGDAWELVLQRRSFVGEALPLVTIVTLSATGSEGNSLAVISNPSTKQKLSVGGPSLQPKVSFLDPQNTFSVNSYQTAAGSADILSHLIENYFSKSYSTNLQDSIAEAIMTSVIKNCTLAIKDPCNYDARSNLMWASTLAMSGLTEKNEGKVWSCHPMEHELSAFYDITHGVGLAILTPRWLDFIMSSTTIEKIATFARNVFGVEEKNSALAAKQGIKRLYNYFKSCGIPMTFSEVGINEENFDIMSERAIAHSNIRNDAYVPMEKEDIKNIYNSCLFEYN